MALEDLAMMRSVYGSVVLYRFDGASAARLKKKWRISRASAICARPVKRPPFEIGGRKVLKGSAHDKAALVAAGITLHESLKAYEQLQQAGIAVRVIDLYSVKPADGKTLAEAARETGLWVVVEDHWPEGGMGDAVLEAFAGLGQPLPRVIKLAVKSMPGSGTPEELMDAAGISARHIVEAVKRAVS